ncbi:MAG TPA: hypothetical protein PLM58_09230 [Novosphingobium sp.]|nr:hypothetical protein [Novosphingobium sp.]
MATHILDAFLVTFGLDIKEFEDGEREVTDRSKRLRDEQKRTFDDIERFGKKTGESIKGLSREVIGLGLAFMGARSITGLISNMMTGAAVADRFGQTLGMNARQVWAWRMAMKSVGGETAEGDQALSAVQRAKMGYRMGTLRADESAAYGRLGITGNDLRNSDAGAILQKLSAAQSKMDPQLYASLLQQIGLPASTIYFLQQGKGSVDKLIAQFEADASGQEALAKEQEQLQQTMTELTTTIQKELVPPLTKIAAWVNDLVGGDSAPAKPDAAGESSWFGGLFKFKQDGGGWSVPGTGKTRADRNNNPGNIEDGPFARRQPGYVGGDGRFAKFASPDHGFGAMEKLLGGYMKQGRNTLSGIISKWAPGHENNVGAYVGHVSKLTGLSPNQRLSAEHIPLIARAMAKHEGYSFKSNTAFSGLSAMHRNMNRMATAPAGKGITINTMTVNTQAKDGHQMLRDVRLATQRRAAVAQSDRVVNP